MRRESSRNPLESLFYAASSPTEKRLDDRSSLVGQASSL
jgi:hypothetical protein